MIIEGPTAQRLLHSAPLSVLMKMITQSSTGRRRAIMRLRTQGPQHVETYTRTQIRNLKLRVRRLDAIMDNAHSPNADAGVRTAAAHEAHSLLRFLYEDEMTFTGIGTMRFDLRVKHLGMRGPFIDTEHGRMPERYTWKGHDGERITPHAIVYSDAVWIERLNTFVPVHRTSRFTGDGISGYELSDWVESNCTYSNVTHEFVHTPFYLANPTRFDEEAHMEANPVRLGDYHFSRSIVRRDPLCPDDERVTLGIELEVQCDDDISRTARAHSLATELRKVAGYFRYAQCERDSSLGDNGFELVTGWTSLDRHKDIWNTIYSRDESNTERRKPLRHLDVDRRCGLHVHVARNAFDSSAHINRMIWFVGQVNHAALMSSVAMRYANQYARSHDYSLESFLENGAAYLLDGKYQMVNPHQSATIEFRLFSATLEREHMFRQLEFVHAVVQYTRTEEDPSMAGFVEFVRDNDKTYPVLAVHLRTKVMSDWTVAKANYRWAQDNILVQEMFDVILQWERDLSAPHVDLFSPMPAVPVE